VAILLAAKLEEAIQPSFKRMIALAESQWEFKLIHEELISLELDITKTLDFDLLFASALFFLERFQRLFSLDQTKDDSKEARVNSLSRDLLHLVLLNPIFISFPQSHIAASVLLLSINIINSSHSACLGKPSSASQPGSNSQLALWTPTLESHTALETDSIKLCYQNLTRLVEDNDLFQGLSQGQLSADPSIII